MPAWSWRSIGWNGLRVPLANEAYGALRDNRDPPGVGARASSARLRQCRALLQGNNESAGPKKTGSGKARPRCTSAFEQKLQR